MAGHLLLLFCLSLLFQSAVALSDLKLSYSQKRAKSLFARQSCPSGEKVCGVVCIPSTYTCCPDRAGGCPATHYCSLGTNGEYGCCLDGKICAGTGGAITSYTTSTSTRSSTYTTSLPTTVVQTPVITATALSWITATVTYDSGTRTVLSYALYGGGYVSNSAQLQWETTIVTRNGLRTTATIASYPADGVADNLDWVTLTATLDNGVRTTISYAYYDGGYVTSSDQYVWSTRTRTFSDGDIETFTVVSYKTSCAVSVQTTSGVSSRSTAIVSTTALSTQSTTAVSSSRTSFSSATATVSPSQFAASSDGEKAVKHGTLFTLYVVAAGTIFLTMLWL